MAALIRQLGPSYSIEAFTWSGRNSVVARQEAAKEFCEHLQRTNDPDQRNVIVAHSHGGTVAAEAIAQLKQSSFGKARVHGLICLATPFVYLVRPTPDQLRTAIYSLASLVMAVYWFALLSLFPSIAILFADWEFAAIVAIKSSLVFLLGVLIVGWLDARISKLTPHLPDASDVPIFLLRATRDEAALALGLMAAFTWLSSHFAKLHDHAGTNITGFGALLAYALVYALCALGGLSISPWAQHVAGVNLSQFSSISLGVLVFGPAVAGLVYSLGYALLSFAVGHRDLRRWIHTTVEVDAAPPNQFCTFKAYSEIDSHQALRHGLYENEKVIEDVVKIICQLSESPN